jgi:hypothetical protein
LEKKKSWGKKNASDRLLKGPELLQTNLDATKDADIVVIATWNDLGEGTSINRQYDYYYVGEWLSPTYFMDITRRAQCSSAQKRLFAWNLGIGILAMIVFG